MVYANACLCTLNKFFAFMEAGMILSCLCASNVAITSRPPCIALYHGMKPVSTEHCMYIFSFEFDKIRHQLKFDLAIQMNLLKSKLTSVFCET